VPNPLRSFKTFNHILGFQGFLKAAMVHFTRSPVVLDAKIDGFAAPVHVRVPSTDLRVYEQFMLRKEYDLPAQREPSFIVDAGANIGLASVFFANRYPHARILSLEPEKSNYDMLVRNAAPYPNIKAVRGALWSETTELNVIDPGLGSWGFQVGAQNGATSGAADQTVHAFTVETIMRDFGVEKIDILKIDIEGSELEIFQTANRWIDKVDSLVVELHEQLRPGCSRVFYNATNDFEHEWMQGELVCLTRGDGCLIPPKQAARA
jgi:FkbM family methyltransferase